MTTTTEATLTQGVLHLVFATESGLNTMDDPWFESLESQLHRAAGDKTVRAVFKVDPCVKTEMIAI
jgi:enoyl-CoA hydratase/carnithine racemase